MIVLSSIERLKVAKLMSIEEFDGTESASIDFCESMFKNYSVMAITTFSGELRQLVPLFRFIFRKPGESADNVERGLRKADELMQKMFGINFEPKYYTSDNSGAIENGIIRVKGEDVKARLGSDKLHDENNITRVLKTIPTKLQEMYRKEIKLMINGLSPEVSEKIFENLIEKSKGNGYDRLYRSLLFNYRK